MDVRACGINHLDLWVRARAARPRARDAAHPRQRRRRRVAAIGAERGGGTKWARGSSCIPTLSCGACEACLAGDDHLCRHLRRARPQAERRLRGEGLGAGRQLPAVSGEPRLARGRGDAARVRHRVAHAGGSREARGGRDLPRGRRGQRRRQRRDPAREAARRARDRDRARRRRSANARASSARTHDRSRRTGLRARRARSPTSAAWTWCSSTSAVRCSRTWSQALARRTGGWSPAAPRRAIR